MRIISAAVLGAIQGATEFLPVSSSGHLVIFHTIFKYPHSLSFDVILHLATALAVIVYFWRDITRLMSAFFRGLTSPVNCFKSDFEFRISVYLIIGSVPAAIIGFTLEEHIEKLFSSMFAVGLFLMVTGIIILFAENYSKSYKNEGQITFWDAVIIGLAQAAAIAPGISRSGATISASLFRGFNRDLAARFSFLLSLPVIFGAGLYQLTKIWGTGFDISWLEILLGCLAAFISAIIAIHFFISRIRRHSIKVYSYYCMILGTAIVILFTIIYLV
jgi:undecaprenyl-diphosphatase